MANTRWPTSRFVELPNATGTSASGRGVDLQHGHVGVGIAAHQPGVVGLAVEERDVDFAGALDDVEVGQHVARPVDHHAASLAFRHDLEQQEAVAGDALRVDVHHAPIDLLIDQHIDPFFGRERIRSRGIRHGPGGQAGCGRRGEGHPGHGPGRRLLRGRLPVVGPRTIPSAGR